MLFTDRLADVLQKISFPPVELGFEVTQYVSDSKLFGDQQEVAEMLLSSGSSNVLPMSALPMGTKGDISALMSKYYVDPAWPYPKIEAHLLKRGGQLRCLGLTEVCDELDRPDTRLFTLEIPTAKGKMLGGFAIVNQDLDQTGDSRDIPEELSLLYDRASRCWAFFIAPELASYAGEHGLPYAYDTLARSMLEEADKENIAFIIGKIPVFPLKQSAWSVHAERLGWRGIRRHCFETFQTRYGPEKVTVLFEWGIVPVRPDLQSVDDFLGVFEENEAMSDLLLEKYANKKRWDLCGVFTYDNRVEMFVPFKGAYIERGELKTDPPIEKAMYRDPESGLLLPAYSSKNGGYVLTAERARVRPTKYNYCQVHQKLARADAELPILY